LNLFCSSFLFSYLILTSMDSVVCFHSFLFVLISYYIVQCVCLHVCVSEWIAAMPVTTLLSVTNQGNSLKYYIYAICLSDNVKVCSSGFTVSDSPISVLCSVNLSTPYYLCLEVMLKLSLAQLKHSLSYVM